MFDAGAIEARLTIDRSQFSRDLAAAEAEVKRFEDQPHRVKISAVFDNASTSKARQAFSQLDNAISKDAMNRLRSSPNGSVLGALNALFSPHPVTGAPSPQQSAQQGLLGKIINAPGGGGSQAGAGGVTRTNGNIINTLTAGKATPAAGNQIISTTNRVNTIGLPTSGGIIGTTDRVNVVGLPTSGGTITTQDKLDSSSIKAQATQAGADAADAANKGATDQARRNGSGWFKGMLAGIGGLVSSAIGGAIGGGAGGKAGAKSGSGGAGSAAGGILGGIGPNILGANFLGKAGAIGFGGAAALGGLGPLLAGAGALGLGGVGAGALGLLFKGTQSNIAPLSSLASSIQNTQIAGGPQNAAQAKTLAAQQAQLASGVSQLSPALRSIFNSEQQISNWWQNFTGSFAPKFAGPLATVANMLQGLGPTLSSFFSSAFIVAQPLISGLGDVLKQLLPALGSTFSAAAPLLRPLLDGLGSLVANILPGIVALLKVAGPAIGVFAQVLGTLGSDIGGVFAAFAPVINQSAVLFKAIFDVVGALLPIIGKLAAIFAVALAPVFTQFAKVVQALLPFLVIIGKLFADLAGAVFGDLVSAFTALAKLLIGVSPALTAFANAISSVFTVLENSGVFAILGNAVENLAKPLAGLISALLMGLVPILPPIIKFIGQLSGLLAVALSNAIATLIPPLITLTTGVFQVLAAILPVILPLLLTFAGIFTGALVQVITSLATALGDIINAFPPAVLGAIVTGILAVIGAMKLFAAVSALLAVDPPVLILYAIVAAVALVVIAIAELVTHWSAVWGAIKTAAADAWNFIYNGFGKYLLPLLGPAGLIALAAIELYQHWNTIWSDIKAVVSGVVTFFTTSWTAITSALKTAWNAIATFFTSWWNAEVTGWKTTVGTIEGVLSGAWTLITNALKVAWNAVSSFFTGWWNGLTAIFRSSVATVESVLSAAWATVASAVSTAWAGIVSFFSGIPGKIVRALAALAGDMGTVGKDAIAGLFSGITGALSNIGNWVNNNIVQPVIGAVKRFFGISSPSTVMAGIGGHLVGGLIKGIVTSGKGLGSLVSKVFGTMPKALLHLVEKGIVGLAGLPGKAISALKGLGSSALSVLKSAGGAISSAWDALFGGGGSGTPATSGTVASWITQALKATGSPLSWLGPLEILVSKESGGNPKAVNPISVMGEHASGLFQTLPSTYAQFATVSGGVFNPVADAVAGIRYLTATYGSPFNIPGLLGGTYRGYATGGLIQEPVLGYGLASGAMYGFGESGPEMVTPMGGRTATGGDGVSSAAVLARLDRLIEVMGAVPAGVGRHVGGAINGASQAASFRNRYPLGGS